MVPIDLDTFERAADDLYEQIPPKLLDRLNGGIVIYEEEKTTESAGRAPSQENILGEYIEDRQLGYQIRLYYGSFVARFAGQDQDVWRAHLWRTMISEIRAHLEARAGLSDLDAYNFKQLEALEPRRP